MNRRNFIEKTSLAAIAAGFPTIVPASVLGKNAPSNRISVGLIGVGRQGFGQNLQGVEIGGGRRIAGLLELPDVQIAAICDVDSWRLGEAKKVIETHYAKNTTTGKYKGCSTYGDFRDIINRKDIDAVMISTPDYWHVPMGIMAAKAKMHVCCEKPLSMSVHQGMAFAEAVKKYGVVNRTDSEFRSIRIYNQAVELIRNGRIGNIQKIEIVFPSDPTPVPVQMDMPVPKELNYDMWLGPCQSVPYTDMRVHTPFDLIKRPNWMRVDTYAQGMITNWGAHYFDISQWANNSENTGPVEVEGKGDFPKSLWNTMINFEVKYKYANGVELSCKQTPTSKPSIRFIGSNGWLLSEGYAGELKASDPSLLTSNPQGNEINLSKTLGDKADFIDAIKTNRTTLEPIEVGHRTISISQIGLIACQLQEKLKWNPEKELFEGNNAANALLAAPLSRKEWAL